MNRNYFTIQATARGYDVYYRGTCVIHVQKGSNIFHNMTIAKKEKERLISSPSKDEINKMNEIDQRIES